MTFFGGGEPCLLVTKGGGDGVAVVGCELFDDIRFCARTGCCFVRTVALFVWVFGGGPKSVGDMLSVRTSRFLADLVLGDALT